MKEPAQAPTADEKAILRKLLAANAHIVADVLDPAEGTSAASVMAALRAAHSLDEVVDDIVHTLVRQARAEGHTWAEIGEVFKTSRQAAWQRFGSSSGPTVPTPPAPPTPPMPPSPPTPPPFPWA
ncbi:hypothetical protein [Nocardia wallacei]|uniref:hypothetical protein n=1 Tax=Nocardia wallacei TaxID=480035 RepID=UPI002454E456|nr:hypothetical protein [Nocardia wallacei]